LPRSSSGASSGLYVQSCRSPLALSGCRLAEFLAANAASAVIWVAVLLGSTAAAGKIVETLPLSLPLAAGILLVVMVAVLATLAIARWLRR
jgi:membrane protein DedA with SNARE-associated domain